MGTYINKGNFAFQGTRNSEYVDKSELIAIVNKTLLTRQRYSCVSRSRRFGKSMAAEMLCAYYDKSCDSRHLFQDLKIASHPSFEQHLNKYPVIYVDMTNFVTDACDDIVDWLDNALVSDIIKAYPQVPTEGTRKLMDYLMRVNDATTDQFIFIIDEWDAICREYASKPEVVDRYVGWLRRMFKSVDGFKVFAGVYLTGILPIKKYSTQSAMNRSAQRDACLSKNFQEYSMVEPRSMAPYFGFTKDEVKSLAEKHGMDFSELEKWYDGYQIGDDQHIFNPNSVMQAIDTRRCRSFWASTGAFDTAAHYISMNFEGLKDDIVKMLAGGRCSVDPTGFQNDLSVIHFKDDVLTVLIHLGYLSYDWKANECYIPNHEVAGEMVNAVRKNNWTQVYHAIEKSANLLEATLRGDEEAVARGIDAAHDENTSILSYNDENSMACVLAIAYYAARDKYIVHREYASGKGFADLVLIPRKHVDSPAVIVELKYNKDADTAISQILHKQYPAKVAEYADNLLLVGISYDKESKRHECKIEKVKN
ncbi:MAG: ATP-binding protein [Prevotella sp.]|nr:ATP-binding protein [Prevotella sp.]